MTTLQQVLAAVRQYQAEPIALEIVEQLEREEEGTPTDVTQALRELIVQGRVSASLDAERKLLLTLPEFVN